MKKRRFLDVQSIILGVCVIAAALIGLFYTNGGKSFDVVNMYGNTVRLYGDGIYAYNSILNVSAFLGANVSVVIVGALLIALSLWKNRPLWAEILRTSEIAYLVYNSACNVFGVSMNGLYLLYVLCFGIGLFTAFPAIGDLFHQIDVPPALKNKKLKGTAIFLILSGVIIALLWISEILPANITGQYGTLLGIQTNEVTFGLDLGITCPILILCGIWLFQKRDSGYKTALILLNTLANVAVLVLLQRAYCLKLGVEIPLQALIGFIISFVILGVIALYLLIRLVLQLQVKKQPVPLT